ncbi:hypothetical protein [Dyadobacter sp. CY356]|uniref:hypothetical protein n=1 Tax=Dyadobacter sp. CY356 TaxID=2906442 RepID=UPI001F1E6476|nr:hypothetical protein [Dyadobacter sp. CY356]MCF0055015.1 hypothetical protein [Dyadobacter sp. CY356]
MESRNNISHTANRDSVNFLNQSFENTNPFNSPSKTTNQPSHPVAKAGKRPRIMRPLYSARLS